MKRIPADILAALIVAHVVALAVGLLTGWWVLLGGFVAVCSCVVFWHGVHAFLKARGFK